MSQMDFFERCTFSVKRNKHDINCYTKETQVAKEI